MTRFSALFATLVLSGGLSAQLVVPEPWPIPEPQIIFQNQHVAVERYGAELVPDVDPLRIAVMLGTDGAELVVTGAETGQPTVLVLGLQQTQLPLFFGDMGPIWIMVDGKVACTILKILSN